MTNFQKKNLGMNTDSDLRKEVKKDQIIERELGPPPQNGCTLLMYAVTVRSINSVSRETQRS